MPSKKNPDEQQEQPAPAPQRAPGDATDGRYEGANRYQARYAPPEELYSPEFLAQLRAREESIRVAPVPAGINPGFAPHPPHGSPANYHSEQEGWLVDLRDAAKTALASDAQDVDTLRGQVRALAGCLFEVVRMIEHFDVKSDSRGRGH